jgi:gamma-glutamylcyclotransferase (GGCT)/AIG2-like uncharacterized protein YtfP
MDNRRDLPGYKYYVDPQTGERPQVYVAFLDLVPDPRATVNGAVFPATGDQLAALDARERNYARREVTHQIDPPAGGRAYAYFGTEDARRRFDAGPTVVARGYLDLIHAGFERLGPGELAHFEASTDPPAVPIVLLERTDLPN